MTEITNSSTVFHFDSEGKSFEDLARPNGFTYWMEDDLRDCMGYTDKNAFRRVIMRAMQACLSIGILPDDNFIRDGDEYKLTRFACYLIAMNGDVKKKEVALAQVYFAALASTYATHIEHANGIDRLVIRDEIRTTAAQHGVSGKGYALFKDAGYRGMYNMSLKQLKHYKGLKASVVIADHMDKAELAAHLFRITQTEAKINQQNLNGQRLLEQAAMTVGADVRSLVIKNTGKPPEDLRPAEPIQKVKTKIKGTNKNLTKIDRKKKDS